MCPLKIVVRTSKQAWRSFLRSSACGSLPSKVHKCPSVLWSRDFFLDMTFHISCNKIL